MCRGLTGRLDLAGECWRRCSPGLQRHLVDCQGNTSRLTQEFGLRKFETTFEVNGCGPTFELSRARLRPTYLGLTDASLFAGLALETDASVGLTMDSPEMVSKLKKTDSLSCDGGGRQT